MTTPPNLESLLKIPCPHCALHLEFPRALHGELIACPGCGCSVLLKVPGMETAPSPAPPVFPPPLPPAAPPRSAYLKRKSEFMGVGCLVQGLGLLLLLLFPIGTVVGVLLLLIGGRMAIKYCCGDCGNPVADKSVRFCPACRCALKPGGLFQ